MRTLLSILAAISVTLIAYNFTRGADKPTPAAATAVEEKPGCHANTEEVRSGCCAMVPVSAPAATQPTTAPAAKLVDVKNTKCIVTEEDIGDATLTYEGKMYHLCCGGCADDFNKDPKKFLKALAEHPEKYGVK